MTYLDELYAANFYEKLGNDRKTTFHFGQIYQTHAYYPHINTDIFRPISDPNEPTQTRASRFEYVTSATDKFNRKYPLHTPTLAADEEFLVMRAKYRPVVLICPELQIPAGIAKGNGRKLATKRCIVAQVFSVYEAANGRAKFTEDFLDRVRLLEYPQFLYLPKKTSLFTVDSLLRIDETQSVYIPHLDTTEYKISEELCRLLRGQIQTLFSTEEHEDYSNFRSLLSS